MSGVPFGFSPGGGGGDDPSRRDEPASDPLSALLGGLLGSSGLADLQAMLGADTGPVNWTLARRTALHVAGEGEVPPTAAETQAVADALRLADVWLDGATILPSGVSSAKAWRRSEWVEATLPVWTALIDPVASRVTGAMSGALMPAVPAEMQAMLGPLLEAMGKAGGLFFGGQVGHAIGSLAREVVGGTDIGLPLAADATAGLIPQNLTAAGGQADLDQTRLYLALREAAHARLFGHVPWLRAHLLGAVEDYARGVVIDPEAIQQALGGFDLSSLGSLDPEQLQSQLGEGLFTPQVSPEQRAALTRLETALALVEGWVDEVADAAARDHLPAAAALREAVRRRRAAGGPAEQTFASLVGLELRPRRLRDAAGLWSRLLAVRGLDGRDAVWAHPDLLPGAGDLDDPEAFARREHDIAAMAADLDEELRNLAAPGATDAGDGPADNDGPADDEGQTGGGTQGAS